MAAQPTIVVLAAGRSARFGAGHHKLAQALGESTVLAKTIASAIATHLRTVVVTTAAFVDIARSSVAARDVVVLPEVGSDGASLLGMGVSIATPNGSCIWQCAKVDPVVRCILLRWSVLSVS
jgi:molybdenum cofactor cytidylyltransferase